MSGIFGILGISDTERAFVNTIGQRVVYDAVGELLNLWADDLQRAISVFVDQTTEEFKWRYQLPGGGYLQRRGGQAPSGAVKAYGNWDVAFPLEDFGAAVGGTDIDLAYMTVQELDRHLDTVMLQDMNTVRLEVLKALFDNVKLTFKDPIHGDLDVQPLANGDAVVYPPVLGSDTEATESHYIESGYLASAISDTNNPIKTAVDELEEHFGSPSGGSNIVTFINNAQTAKIEALADFVEVGDRFVQPGVNTAQVLGLPANLPGKIIGRANGSWISEWRFMPSGYTYSQYLDAPKPLVQRVDPAYTGLPRGLVLVSTSDAYPMQSANYRHRFGLGVGNRLNGVVIELGNAGTYTVPTGLSR